MSAVPSAAVTPTRPGPVAPATSPTSPSPTTRYQTAAGCLTLMAITVVALGALAAFVFMFGEVAV